MDAQEIHRLLERFNSGDATQAERSQIEQLLEAGRIGLSDIEALASLEEQIHGLHAPVPSVALDNSFYQMLRDEKIKKAAVGWKDFFSWPTLAPKLAIASITLLLGLVAGYLVRPSTTAPRDNQIEALSLQVAELQEMMMLSLLEKGSATDRLKAVNLTQEMNEASRKVTNALIQTLNQDENVNVRLAALEALKPYATDSSVREALIQSIAKQESPMMQISMAELMVALQERSAVGEFEKIVESDRTPEEVKKKIRESINVLI